MRSHLARIAAATLAALAITVSSQLLGSSAATAAPAPAAVRVLYYDASQAAEFVNVVHQGAANWNARVTNVRLERWTSGRPLNIRVYADNNWPRAYVNSLGNGTIYMGRQATAEGHNPTRIAAHELGHILGLPDRRTGVCSELMSGSSAGTSCTSAFPNAQEITKVNNLFASGALVTAGWREDRA
ncbi:snapalysin family zinc-dependent metalloprotease [Catellatospora sp. NPDC049111]|uniref:snapalysin family zinc-dependent metalloprotease n=1 Tax=Catellatospora sp. NPDC049111 TaxID=3155271 RepID=UPI0033F54AB7